MHMEFSVEDIVMLKEPNRYTSTYINRLNLYKVKKVTVDGYILDKIKEVVSKNDVSPVPIDHNHDKKIYLHYIPINNQWSATGELKPITKNTQYYMDTIKGDSELYEQLLTLSYVHEAQKVIQSDPTPHLKLEIDNF